MVIKKKLKISREIWKLIFLKWKSFFKCMLVDDDDVCMCVFFCLYVWKFFFFLWFMIIWFGFLFLFYCSEIVYEDVDVVIFSGYLKYRKVERWLLVGMLYFLIEKEYNIYWWFWNLKEIIWFNNLRILFFWCILCEWNKKFVIWKELVFYFWKIICN